MASADTIAIRSKDGRFTMIATFSPDRRLANAPPRPRSMQERLVLALSGIVNGWKPLALFRCQEEALKEEGAAQDFASGFAERTTIGFL